MSNKTRRGLLLIDRGSRENEVQNELRTICDKVKEKGGYDYVDYCFLEVIPPYIEEGVKKCLEQNIDTLTIVPYFLYPGRKSKIALNTAAELQSQTGTKFVFTKAVSFDSLLVELVNQRIQSALKDAESDNSDSNLVDNSSSTPFIGDQKQDVDVLIVGHGSKDPQARTSLEYIVDNLKDNYRNVDLCFLEIEQPDIPTAIKKCSENSPRVLVVMFYFLHEGAHVKRDIFEDLNPAVEQSNLNKVVITKHLGTDQKMIELVLKRAGEAERENFVNPEGSDSQEKKVANP